ncbi:Csl4p homologue, putative [Trypanosoma brucei gambiense DAL972]|uniref:Exosome component CSL4 n=2 Tax=Trypanosoma brucei TaxID=5691 RepID=C9ZNQ1_TRYB9|nr:Csl4p homologue, putative [Trypanosoma brucei gambiense DAL972]RHW72529.1 exosome component CSL4 [Trypanosoma brucei equiperdum]CBH11029.1 Csl4p homologue, putative [Trypanosoma brucei gambiense DAL972]|eukprot:XP_011773316.1 Csl4p homologue, putative [Trypanosoma brucei gambiense DAL972]
MAVIVKTGKCVSPGDVLYATDIYDAIGTIVVAASDTGAVSAGNHADDAIIAGTGCYSRVVSKPDGAVSSQIITTLLGIVQWSGNVVSVRQPTKRARDATTIEVVSLNALKDAGTCGDSATPRLSTPGEATSSVSETPASTAVSTAPKSLWISTSVFGPRMGDNVHLRVVRVSRSFAYGEIIAVNGTWCSNSGSNGGGGGALGGFRGVIRMEDIRPFKPRKDQLSPPPPADAFQDGDVVVATVLSQSDVRQYQLSTVAEHCGVVEAFTVLNSNGRERRVRLRHIPECRDMMKCPLSGNLHRRWCPLIRLV